jgi:hypothetical protein
MASRSFSARYHSTVSAERRSPRRSSTSTSGLSTDTYPDGWPVPDGGISRDDVRWPDPADI